MPARATPGIRTDASSRAGRCPDRHLEGVTVAAMNIVTASEDLTALLGEGLDSLCSLLPVRWGPLEVAMRQVALVEGRPVGQVTVLRGGPSESIRGVLAEHEVDLANVAECTDLVVRSSFRNRGVGSELLASITRAADADGTRLVALVAADAHDARKTFLSGGWTEIGSSADGIVMLGPDVSR